jgi:hypothetical protein
MKEVYTLVRDVLAHDGKVIAVEQRVAGDRLLHLPCPPYNLGLFYIIVANSTHLLVRRFTFMSMCGMKTGNRCPYPPFPFPTYYPDTGTGSKDSNRTFVGPLTQPLFKHTSQRLTPLHTLSPHSSSPMRLHVGRFDHRQRCPQI